MMASSLNSGENVGKFVISGLGEKPYGCRFCLKKFSQKSNCRVHERIHTGEKPYGCRFCTKKFSRVANWKRHELIHTGEKPFQCRFCDKKFSQKDGRQRHELIHTGEKPFQCRFCDKKFSQKGGRQRHELIHTGDKPFQCRFCDKKFIYSGQRDVHQRIHTGEKPYGCRFCVKKFSQTSQRQLHERIHTGEKPYGCRFCDKNFKDISSLRVHERVHSGEKPFECRFCDTKFRQTGQRKVHERIHTGEKPYKCRFCHEAFRQSSHRQLHELKHSVPESDPCHSCGENCVCSSILQNTRDDRPEQSCLLAETSHSKSRDYPEPNRQVLVSHSASFLCNSGHLSEVSDTKHTGENQHGCRFCTKKLATSSGRRLHERIHTGEKPYQCRFCDKDFTDSSSCRVHERIHTGEKPYQCRFCDKDFTDNSSLRVHERIHTGEKPYQCRFCDKKFSILTNCRVHERIHTGEKPYQCRFCDKDFTDNSSLRVHERIHTGEKPYQCRFCDKKFSILANLRVHERIHTGEKPHKCRFCHETFRLHSHRQRHERTHSVSQSDRCHSCGENCVCSSSLQNTRDDRPEQSCLLAETSHSKSRDYPEPNRQVLVSHSTSPLHNSGHLSDASDTKLQRPINSKRHFLCAFCGKTFIAAILKKQHEKRMHQSEIPRTIVIQPNSEMRKSRRSSGNHACSGCGRSFRFRSGLVLHQKAHKQCRVRGKGRKVSVQRIGQSDHRDQRDEPDSYQGQEAKVEVRNAPRGSVTCGICHKSFPARRGLLIHTSRSHKPKSFSCSKCYRKFTTNSLRDFHSWSSCEKMRTCGICRIVAPDTAGLVDHVVSLHRDYQSGKFQLCFTCGRLISKKQISAHEMSHQELGSDFSDKEKDSHVPRSLDVYECSMCDVTFPFKHSLVLHEKAHVRYQQKVDKSIQEEQDSKMDGKPKLNNRTGKSCLKGGRSLQNVRKTSSRQGVKQQGSTGKLASKPVKVKSESQWSRVKMEKMENESEAVGEKSGEIRGPRTTQQEKIVNSENKRPGYDLNPGRSVVGRLQPHLGTKNTELSSETKQKRRFLCTYCGKGFGTALSTVLHARRAHYREQRSGSRLDAPVFIPKIQKLEGGSHVCSECGRGFRYKSGLVLHQKAHTRRQTRDGVDLQIGTELGVASETDSPSESTLTLDDDVICTNDAMSHDSVLDRRSDPMLESNINSPTNSDDICCLKIVNCRSISDVDHHGAVVHGYDVDGDHNTEEVRQNVSADTENHAASNDVNVNVHVPSDTVHGASGRRDDVSNDPDDVTVTSAERDLSCMDDVGCPRPVVTVNVSVDRSATCTNAAGGAAAPPAPVTDNVGGVTNAPEISGGVTDFGGVLPDIGGGACMFCDVHLLSVEELYYHILTLHIDITGQNSLIDSTPIHAVLEGT